MCNRDSCYTRALCVHGLLLVDIGESAEQEPVQCFEVLRRELEAYNPELLEKPFAIAATKKDIQGDGARLKRLVSYCRKKKYDCLSISAVTGDGISDLVRYLGVRVRKARGRIAPGVPKPAETT